VISRNVLIFGLVGTGPHFFVRPAIDATVRVTVGLNGKSKRSGARASARSELKRERLALHHPGFSVDSVPPRELDVPPVGVWPVRVLPRTMFVSIRNSGAVQVGLWAAGVPWPLVEAEELREHGRLRVLVVVLQQFDAVDRRQREQ
jgi:hypothetical protein